jgi:hypothetical protein
METAEERALVYARQLADLREAMRGILDFLLERLPALPRSFEYYAELIGDPHYFDALMEMRTVTQFDGSDG